MKAIDLTASGKWILAGEHSVLRGQDALVFPLESKKISIAGHVGMGSDRDTIDITATGEMSDELPALFAAVISRAYDILDYKGPRLSGALQIKNDLPFGAGLGASASACVLVAKVFLELGLIQEPGAFQFARNLENLFHGESSGVDIAATLENKPIRFNREKGYQALDFDFRPVMTLHYTGKRGVTRECIEVVRGFAKNHSEQALLLDKKMQEAVEHCYAAFKTRDPEFLIKGINQAQDIYRQWGLIDPVTDKLIQDLKSSGAVAVKPTGSGLGGYVLAMWSRADEPWSFDSDCLWAFSEEN